MQRNLCSCGRFHLATIKFSLLLLGIFFAPGIFPDTRDKLVLDYMDAGKNVDAAILLEEILAEHPGRIDAWVNRGILYRREGRLDKAETCYRQAIELNSLNIKAHYNLGIILMKTGRYPEAEKEFRYILSQDDKNAAVNFNLAVLLMKYDEREPDGKHLREAAMLLEKALIYGSDSGTVLFNLAWISERNDSPYVSIAAYRKSMRHLSPENLLYKKAEKRIEYLKKAYH